jgi:2-polyprenyl-3-methyl-5-hydroxy-6-metoxy-1,4-benzoquinol methylase
MVNIQAISNGLKLGSDGIWYSEDQQSVSYPSDGNEICQFVEDESFWFKHRNECIATVVKSYPPGKSEPIFDIGGGNGFVSLGLTKEGFNMVLVEPGLNGVANAKKRGLKNLICATTETARFRAASLPAVGLFDVIEHIEDDLSFLRSINALLRHKGRLYATVPSYRFLWSQEDDLAGHFRRYTLKEISKVLQSAGFEVEFASYIFRILPVPIFLLRALPYKLGRSKATPNNKTAERDHMAQGGVASRVMSSIFASEIEHLENNRTMRFGGSCLIVARCP